MKDGGLCPPHEVGKSRAGKSNARHYGREQDGGGAAAGLRVTVTAAVMVPVIERTASAETSWEGAPRKPEDRRWRHGTTEGKPNSADENQTLLTGSKRHTHKHRWTYHTVPSEMTALMNSLLARIFVDRLGGVISFGNKLHTRTPATKDVQVRRLINEPALDVDVKGGGVGAVPRQALHGLRHVDRNVAHLPLNAVLAAAAAAWPQRSQVYGAAFAEFAGVPRSPRWTVTEGPGVLSCVVLLRFLVTQPWTSRTPSRTTRASPLTRA
ncbi:hypothetical protein HPB50_009931 [Hyalomma asiaticum]|uniref:Uncharacterized protein n=1 Tax=Hyalomma asiaticum TaxID=266040 RepID=A0ACB7S8X9_HYAAI|nr:hypothetical protein HPB50_009931 [Hyalomma asiaticum]